MVGYINSALLRSITRSIDRSSRSMSDSLQRIASGNRFVSPSDEAAQQASVRKLDSQLRGVQQAGFNVSQASGLVKEADDKLQNMMDIATSLREIALEASNEDLSAADRSLLQEETSILMQEFAAYSDNTSFKSFKLLNGTFGTQSVHTGPNSGDSFQFSIGDARSNVLGKLAIYSGAQGSIASGISGGANSLSFNNVYINASTDDGFSTLYADRSGLSLANAINAQSSQTSVYAEALATERTLYIDDFTGSYTGNFESGDFSINGYAITGAISDTTDLVAQINSHSENTGVRASIDGNGDISLIAADGRNIQVTVSNAATNNVFDIFNVSANNDNDLFDSGVVVSSDLSSGSSEAAVGAIQIYSSEAIYVSGGSSASATIGFATGNKALVSGTTFANVDVSTADDADQAIKILDSTIADISTLRANIGAVHDRLDRSATSLLQSEANLSETKTALSGTDFAKEVANLAMAQLLQDASLTSLTQANVSARKVTDLLKSLDPGD